MIHALFKQYDVGPYYCSFLVRSSDLVCQSYIYPISLFTCFPALLLSLWFLYTICAVPSLSGVHWALMESIDLECRHGWLLIVAEAMEAWRPFSEPKTELLCLSGRTWPGHYVSEMLHIGPAYSICVWMCIMVYITLVTVSQVTFIKI